MANTMIPVEGAEVFGKMSDEFIDWTNTEGLLGKDITINGFKMVDSKLNPGAKKAIIDFSHRDEPESYGWSTEGKAVKSALFANSENLPFDCKVVQLVSKKNGKPYPVLA